MYRTGPHAGLFQACAGLLYPAFRENVETLDALSFFAEEDDKEIPFQRILSLAFQNNLSYFKRNGRIHGLPFEGLPTKELPEASTSGTAIFAADQVFNLARLQIAMKD